MSEEIKKKRSWKREKKEENSEFDSAVPVPEQGNEVIVLPEKDDTEVRRDVLSRFKPGHKKIEGSGIQKGQMMKSTIIKKAVDNAVKQFALQDEETPEEKRIKLEDLEQLALQNILEHGLKARGKNAAAVKRETGFRVMDLIQRAKGQTGGGSGINVNGGITLISTNAEPVTKNISEQYDTGGNRVE